MPRELEDVRNYDKWKANQLRAFFLFYAYPVLKNYLSGQIFDHLCLFVAILHSCLSKSVTANQITELKINCDAFLELHQKIFGKVAMNSNIHDIVHYPHFIENYGSFFNYSLFPFEEINRKIHFYNSGDRNLQKQIARGFFISRFLEIYHEENESRPFYKRHIEFLDTSGSINRINNNIGFIGIKSFYENTEIVEQFSLTSSLFEIYKIYIGNILINSIAYNKKYNRKMNNFTVEFQVDEISKKYCYIENLFFSGCKCLAKIKYLAVKKIVSLRRTDIRVHSIFEIEETNDVDVIEVDERISPIFNCIDVLILPPNDFEFY